MAPKLTNRRALKTVEVKNPRAHGTRPYIASTQSGLTEKERAARQQERMSKTAHSGISGGGFGGFGGFGSGFGGAGGAAIGNTSLSQQGNFYSAQLSTDFLELPQSLRERREVYQHFYNSDELVGQAIDLHTELPLSKVRLAAPKPRKAPEGFASPEDYGKYILSRFEKMSKKMKLFQKLIKMVHHYWLDGACVAFAEDSFVEMPDDVGHKVSRTIVATLTSDGEPVETESVELEPYGDREDRELAYYQKHYEGWSKIIVLPADHVKITTFNYTDKSIIELIPSDSDKSLIQKAKQGDLQAQRLVEEIPAEVRDHIESGQLIPLGTDPDEGSFAHILTGSKSAESPLGQSILNRCLRTLIFRDKLRQAQTQIASRAMTPKRVVWAEGLSDLDTDLLRDQVDQALVDPDYSIVTNYEVHWEEMGARDRLLDLSSEYEQTERRLISGLGVTESLMSGESLYSGDRLKLEVINQRYLHLREILQDYVEDYLFRPVAERMGFVEEDEWGQKVVLYPKLSFTRLPLRDSQDTFDALYNLYSKGSISIDLILEMLNIDPNDTRLKIERDLFTVNDALFNETLRSMYNEVGRVLTESTDVVERFAKYLKLEPKPQEDTPDEGRF